MNPSDKSESTGAAKFNILIVDSDEHVIDSITRELERENKTFNIDKTTDGQTALSLLEQKRYDLVITDLDVPYADGVPFIDGKPSINGIEVLKKAKTLQPDSEVILITEYSSEASVLAALHFGAFDCILKPFNMSELKMKITQAVEKRSERAQMKETAAELEALYSSAALDLKTAALSIKEFANILMREHAEKLQSGGRFLVSRILANTASLEYTIRGFLDYTRIGRIEFPWTNINTPSSLGRLP